MRTRHRFGRALAAVAVATALVAACGSTTDVAFELVAAPAAAEVIHEQAPDVVVLDVRTPEEFVAGHLANAQNVDFYASDFASQLDELDKDTPYVVYCRSGNRSASAIEIMRNLGFTEVWEVDGGIIAWEQAGLKFGS